MKKFISVGCVLMFILCQPDSKIWAQDLVINRIELEGKKVFIFYNLLDSTRGRHYSVNLYASRDNYLNPLQKISGDAGLDLLPGSNRKIEWNAAEEMGADFEGKVGLELRAKIYIPFIRLEGFEDFKKFKRDKAIELTWTGGRPQNILNFDLYKQGERITTFPNIPNVGNYSLTFPQSIKPGKDYTFRISDTKNKDEVVNTGEFVIVRKIPLLVKAVPVVLIGGVIFWLLQPEEECPGCVADFPAPPPNN